MKTISIFLLIVILFCFGWFFLICKPQQSIGPEINGWKVGACYTYPPDNPFTKKPDVIMKIIDHKEGWIQYTYYIGPAFSLRSPYSEEQDNVEVIKWYEIKCPLTMFDKEYWARWPI